MFHPLRHRGELTLHDITQNTDQFEDIWMGKRVPKDNLSTELLEMISAPFHLTAETSFPLTILTL